LEGGLRTVDDCSRVLLAGAEKVNINRSGKNPELITKVSKAFGAQAIVSSMDDTQGRSHSRSSSGYEIVPTAGALL